MVQLLQPRHGNRLTLRRHERTDLDALASFFSDPGVNRYLYSEPRDRDATLAALEKRLASPDDVEAIGVNNVLSVAVELRDTGRLVGDFMLAWTENEHHQGEMGGTLHPDVHGRGFATEVYGMLLELGFETYGLHRIVGRCDGRNHASIRSLEKAGLEQEAHLVENEFVKGEWTDEVIMAIREGTWRSRVAN